MKEFNPVIIGYVPPPTYGNPAAFLTNLQRFKTHHPLILFSDYAEKYKAAGVPFDMIPIANPEQQRGARYATGELNKWSTNNLLFLSALRIAQRGNYTHILYLEEDCRVNGDFWDKSVVDEYAALAGDHAEETIGGSIICFGPYNYTRKAAVRWEALLARNSRRNFPIPTYGAGGACETIRPTVLVNGALGIYPVSLMARLFDLNNTAKESAASTAWDFEIGRRMWNIWGEDTFDHVVHLNTIFSSYGNMLTSEEDRRKMLTTGLEIGDGRVMKVVGVHQIKSDWQGPEPVVVAPAETAVVPPPTQLTGPPPAIDGAEPSEAPDILPPAVKGKKKGRPAKVEVTDKFPFRVDILILTHARDARWLELCIQSINRFCRGFGAITVVHPKCDYGTFKPLLASIQKTSHYDINVRVFDEVEGKGHLHHMVQKCMADLHCPDADLICHIDSDCIFYMPTTPADYFTGDKPVLLMTPYSVLEGTHKGHYGWKAVGEAALKESIEFSTMERHPAVHWRELYPALRQAIELKHGTSFENYVLSGNPVFPYGFCEFVTLGAFALRAKEFNQRYDFVNLAKKARPEDRLIQFWSHGAVDEPQEAPSTLPAKYPIAADGKIVPSSVIADILK